MAPQYSGRTYHTESKGSPPDELARRAARYSNTGSIQARPRLVRPAETLIHYIDPEISFAEFAFFGNSATTYCLIRRWESGDGKTSLLHHCPSEY
eukprot:6205191-Pleurochrysis_carterae.AAC.1